MKKYEHAFGKNDIRGIYGDDITEELYYNTGRGFVDWLKKESGIKEADMWITITIDARTHSPSLEKALSDGITSTCANVVKLGLAPTPIGYYSEVVGLPKDITDGKNVIAAAIITASHNPKEYNGLKMTYAKRTLSESQIAEVKEHTFKEMKFPSEPSIPQGQIKEYNIIPDYIKEMKEKLKAGIIGATGMVGQRFITLLENHPYFTVSALAASSRSAGKKYSEAVGDRWKMSSPIPAHIADTVITDAADIDSMAEKCDFVFCAVNMNREEIVALEEAYAKAELPVISNNSANRWTSDVPMVIPEINDAHLSVIEGQRRRLGTRRGFIAVKPNCSIQSYVPMLTPLLKYGIREVVATTYQAISGAGKNFAEWPEMVDNVIPFISGEEEKSEREPLRIWGKVQGGVIVPATAPVITTQCIRVPVTDGHTAAVFVNFENKPPKEAILEDWRSFKGLPQLLGLPSAPEQFITYFDDNARPQIKLDRDIYGGMGVTCGRLREDSLFDYKFVGMSHNTLRGAAGGAVLIAELLYRQGYMD